MESVMISTLSITVGAFALMVFASSQLVYAQWDIDEDRDVESWVMPGIACKTRTNNEASVRNLALGVENQDSPSDVPVNCGWNTPVTWQPNDGGLINSESTVCGDIHVAWVRLAGTSTTAAEEAFCAIRYVALGDASDSPNENGVIVGMLQPEFNAPSGVGVAEADSDTSASTCGMLPARGGSGTVVGDIGDKGHFSAFCRIPQGVRLSGFFMDADVTVAP